MPATEGLHSIGTVSRETGLKPDLLRAWERRYSAVSPVRSAGGQRLYSDGDLARLRLLARVTARGHRIAQVASLPSAELERLAGPVPGADEATGSAPVPSTGAPAESDTLAACLAAVEALDAEALSRALERAGLELGRRRLVEELLVPLMSRIGRFWAEERLGPAHEHLAAAVVRSFVGGLQGAYRSPWGAPRLLVTTPAGQRHELGALVVAAASAAEGWAVTYLGPDLPAPEIASAAATTGARAVALSLSVEDPAVDGELLTLRSRLPETIAVLAGGAAAAAHRAVLSRIGARTPGDLGELRRTLAELRSEVAPP